MCVIRLFAALALIVTGTNLDSHEFWIDAEAYQIEAGANIQAKLVNGQKFSGIDLAYYPKRVVLLDQIVNDERTPVKARPGDSPAVDVTIATAGLTTLLYQSTHDTVRYQDWAKFQKFADHKAFRDIKARHDAKGLGDAPFREVYSRFAKALIAVGDGAGRDAPRGLEIEIVALKNPYTDDISAGLPVKVLYRDMPRIGAQVEIFERAPDGTVSISTLRTDDAGLAQVPVKPGHSYLLDNVLLRTPSAELATQKDAVWETLWAALTFGVPAP